MEQVDTPASPEVPDDAHRRPPGSTDATVAAVGKLSEAWEWVERIRGRLFDFHQMMGRADFLFEDAAAALQAAGHVEEAERVRTAVVGRNVLNGRWSFQLVEEFDDCYYRAVGDVERAVRDRLMEGKRHVFEAEMKEERRTHGHVGHESRPNEAIT